MLCDPVGTGKTYIALALIDPPARALVVAPAVLREMWIRAAEMATRNIDFISLESLSRGRDTRRDHSLLIVDEAHHARNPRTQRYGALALLASTSDVLLLTATPIHNRRADLFSLLSLFLGEAATAMTAAQLARCVVRRDGLSSSLAAMPRTEPLVWCRIGQHHNVSEQILSLPPPLPPRDGDAGGALITHSLLRQWASSDAALARALKRRLARSDALIAALEDGTLPSQRELAEWISGEDTVQLALPGFLADPVSNASEMASVVRNHRREIERLLITLTGRSGADAERADLIRELRKAHCHRRVVVFSQYADTIDGMFKLLAEDGEVAALTGSGARVWGGNIPQQRPSAASPQPPREESLRKEAMPYLFYSRQTC